MHHIFTYVLAFMDALTRSKRRQNVEKRIEKKRCFDRIGKDDAARSI